jgi:xanthine dehydrogenase small subunit
MIRFILNDKLVETVLPPGSTVLDFVRYHKRLTGTKIGCREGDCGACTVLVGDTENNNLVYRSMTSCLMPLGNAEGKHIVTVEGINGKDLTVVQQAMVDCNGTQCGFCTIGFVMSLTGFMVSNSNNYQDAVKSIDGNICRCTGYKSIERACEKIAAEMQGKPSADNISWLAKKGFIPAYFTNIPQQLKELKQSNASKNIAANALLLGGGTDLIVQKHTLVKQSATTHLFDNPQLKNIRIENNQCFVGASVTVTAFAESPLIKNIFPKLEEHIKLVSSTPIRNMATLAGNLVNASPIGDMTVFLLALNAGIVLNNGSSKRTLQLNDFYKSYKQLDKQPGEYIEEIFFAVPSAKAVFGFDKVCKRTYLDIASVNAASLIMLSGAGIVEAMHLAAGGVAPFPKYLHNTADFLKGKSLSAKNISAAFEIMNTEIAPISDARGPADYKR